METIPGAKLNTLVVGGLNDIRCMVSTYMSNKVGEMEEIAELVAKEFNDTLMNLHTMMRDHSKKYKTNNTNNEYFITLNSHIILKKFYSCQ